MNLGLPVAVVVGNNTIAKRLAETLVKSELDVIVVGENLEEWSERSKEIKIVEKIDKIEGGVNYGFDFEISEELWKKVKLGEGKLAIIETGEERKGFEKAKEKLRGINWRRVVVKGLIKEERERWLDEALEAAVKNENLRLPKGKVRILGTNDAAELIMRANLVPGTEGETWRMAGEEIETDKLAEILKSEAQMTKKTVEWMEEIEESDEEKEEVMGSWKRLRFEPKDEIEMELREEVRGKFEKKVKKIEINKEEKSPRKMRLEVETIDEKNDLRSMIHQGGQADDLRIEQENKREEGKKEGRKWGFEVAVEEENDLRSMKDDLRIEQKEKEEEVEEEPIVIKPIKRPLSVEIPRNANMREVKEEKISNDEFLMSKKEEVKPVEIKPVEIKQVEIKPEMRQIEIKEVKTVNEKKVRNWGWIGWVVAGIIIIGVTATPVSWIATGYRAKLGLTKIENLVKEKDYEKAEELALKLSTDLKKVDEEIDDSGWNRLGWVRKYQNLIRVAEKGLVVADEGIDLAKRGEKISGAIFDDKEIDWPKELADLQAKIERADGDIGELQARLLGDWSWLAPDYRQKIKEWQDKLNKLKELVELSKTAVKIVPEFLGLDGKRRDYLVLFQNEMELRPNGGFIGSYGILSFEGGKLINLDIKDIYEADGQLGGHVEPPEEIKTVLNEPSWYMRDANWKADFMESTEDILWFLEKEAGRKVDGVIGVDLAVAKEILGVIGEIKVADFGEKINKNNLYDQAEFYAETKFFPGSKQKANFLGAVGKQLFEEIKDLGPEKKWQLYEAMIDLLQKNEIQIALNEAKTAQVVAGLGWDGAMYEGKCAAERCFADYLYVVEANLGVNKANYFVYRNMEESVDIAGNSIGRILKINYENRAKNSNWPGGDYKNYMRIYLPESSNVAVLKVNGNEVTDYKEKEINGKREIGFLVVVPVGKKVTVELRYVDQFDLEAKDKFSYLSYIQRQPGFGDTGMVMSITFPSGWQPTQVQPMGTVMNGKVLFNQRLDKDMKVGLEIMK